jgi:DNA repair exonuclease SbcCD ATPase subunit
MWFQHAKQQQPLQDEMDRDGDALVEMGRVTCKEDLAKLELPSMEDRMERTERLLRRLMTKRGPRRSGPYGVDVLRAHQQKLLHRVDQLGVSTALTPKNIRECQKDLDSLQQDRRNLENDFISASERGFDHITQLHLSEEERDLLPSNRLAGLASEAQQLADRLMNLEALQQAWQRASDAARRAERAAQDAQDARDAAQAAQAAQQIQEAQKAAQKAKDAAEEAKDAAEEAQQASDAAQEAARAAQAAQAAHALQKAQEAQEAADAAQESAREAQDAADAAQDAADAAHKAAQGPQQHGSG